ncbi:MULTISPECIES: winged helix-turn-helix domain-containing protein [Calditerrivibrio]|uniref:ModE family transcriptional regulator n=1 Tax=Calditerrivibrio nitroreducens TaxID=477976 RepID=A0A2J6WRF2_9BACT|nr:MAG: ModE family transcriptional regulator [Calditerrivibrio nitroreducens]
MKSKPKFDPENKDKTPEDISVAVKNFTLKGRIWIDGVDGTFIGFGRVVLLERIEQYGSISKAAKSMEMSYKHAWELVESMNNQGSKPLVIKTTGGKDGGGAQLTEYGKKVVGLFWELQNNLKQFIEDNKELLKKLN